MDACWDPCRLTARGLMPGNFHKKIALHHRHPRGCKVYMGLAGLEPPATRKTLPRFHRGLWRPGSSTAWACPKPSRVEVQRSGGSDSEVLAATRHWHSRGLKKLGGPAVSNYCEGKTIMHAKGICPLVVGCAFAMSSPNIKYQRRRDVGNSDKVNCLVILLFGCGLLDASWTV